MRSAGISALYTAAVALLIATPAFSQPPAFEAADLKPASPDNHERKGRILPGGRIEIPGQSLKDLMVMAYGVQDDMIVGGPKWVDTFRFDLVAKGPADAQLPQLREMVQTLLTDRFHLVIHREDRSMPAYVLSVGKRPAKYRDGDGGRQTCNWNQLDDGLRERVCKNLSMAEFARQLPGTGGIGIDHPVVDETGLKGAYDFEFVVGMYARKTDGSPVQEGPTIFMALDQIGLKLESRRMPLPAIMIDRAELPSQN